MPLSAFEMCIRDSYNSAWKWFNALQIIPSYFTLALFPIISRAIKQDMDCLLYTSRCV